MKALVLAAGKGSRLGRAAGDVPKPLVELGGTTPLEHTLAWVAVLGPECIWINLHERAPLVRQRVGARVLGVPVRYSYEPELLGSAGAWKKLAAEWLTTSLVVYGDNFMRFDLRALWAVHRGADALVTIAVYDPVRHANTGIGGGRVRVERGRAVEFVEGGDRGLVNTGVYFIQPELARHIPDGFSDFGHDVLPRLAADGLVAAHIVECGAYCLGVDTPDRLAIARVLLSGLVAP